MIRRELRRAARWDMWRSTAHSVARAPSGVEANALIDRLRSALPHQCLVRVCSSAPRTRGFSLDEQVDLSGVTVHRPDARLFAFHPARGSGSVGKQSLRVRARLRCVRWQPWSGQRACAGTDVTNPRVPEGLHGQGIIVPDDAWFVPALHNTTTDELTLVDLRSAAAFSPGLSSPAQWLTAASRLCAQERMPRCRWVLPGRTRLRHPVRRCAKFDGLVAGQAGMGPVPQCLFRHRTTQPDGEPVWTGGPSCTRMTTVWIPSAAFWKTSCWTLVVGQWINMEHYFSTVDSECFRAAARSITMLPAASAL